MKGCGGRCMYVEIAPFRPLRGLLRGFHFESLVVFFVTDINIRLTHIIVGSGSPGFPLWITTSPFMYRLVLPCCFHSGGGHPESALSRIMAGLQPVSNSPVIFTMYRNTTAHKPRYLRQRNERRIYHRHQPKLLHYHAYSNV